MSLKCDVGHRRVSLPSGADCIFVRAGKNSGKDRIVPLRKNSVGSKTLSIFGRNYSTSQYWFEFQKKIYNVCLDHESLKIQRQLYPSIGSIRSILSHSGLDEASAAIAGALWGKNEFDIPLPGFLELYQVFDYFLLILHECLKLLNVIVCRSTLRPLFFFFKLFVYSYGALMTIGTIVL